MPALYPGGYGLKVVFAVHGPTAWIIYVVLLLVGAIGLWSSLWRGPIHYLRRRSYEQLAAGANIGKAAAGRRISLFSGLELG